MDEKDTNGDDMLLLDERTGLAHQFEMGDDRSLITCDCELIESAYESHNLVTISRRWFDVGIWEPSDCLIDDPESGE